MPPISDTTHSSGLNRRSRSPHRRGTFRRPTLLGVWAHPDDEAYLSAGLIAQFVNSGGRVVVVTATHGEAGTEDSLAWPPERLAAQRRRELRSSLSILGVHEVHTLGLPDGGCHLIDATTTVAHFICRVEPDLIVTFGPDGLTGHSDHRAVSAWTTAARDAVRPHADLWYATVTDEFHHTWGAINDTAGFFYPDQPDTPHTEIGDLVHHASLPDALLDLKVRALAAHSTQTARLIQRLGVTTYAEWWRTESFCRAPYNARHLRVEEPVVLAA